MTHEKCLFNKRPCIDEFASRHVEKFGNVQLMLPGIQFCTAHNSSRGRLMSVLSYSFRYARQRKTLHFNNSVPPLDHILECIAYIWRSTRSTMIMKSYSLFRLPYTTNAFT